MPSEIGAPAIAVLILGKFLNQKESGEVRDVDPFLQGIKIQSVVSLYKIFESVNVIFQQREGCFVCVLGRMNFKQVLEG